MSDSRNQTDEYINHLSNLKKLDIIDIISEDPDHDPKYVALYNKPGLVDYEIDDILRYFHLKYAYPNHEYIQHILSENLMEIIKKFPNYDFNNIIMNKCLYLIVNYGSVDIKLLPEYEQEKFSLLCILFGFIYELYYANLTTDTVKKARNMENRIPYMTKKTHMSIKQIINDNKNNVFNPNDLEYSRLNNIKELFVKERDSIKKVIDNAIFNDDGDLSKTDYADIIAYGTLFPASVKETNLQESFNFVFLILCYIGLYKFKQAYKFIQAYNTKTVILANMIISDSNGTIGDNIKLHLRGTKISTFKTAIMHSISKELEIYSKHLFLRNSDLSNIIASRSHYPNITQIDSEKISKLIVSIDNEFNNIGGGSSSSSSIFDKIKNIFNIF